MKKLLITTWILALLSMIFIISCTDNQKAKGYGGKAELNLPPNQKLVTVTWKDNDLWHLTRPMREGEVAETYKFQEESDYGVWEGTYIIREVKK